MLLTEWDKLNDPDGGRLEMLDSQLVTTPPGNADHNRFASDLASILRVALGRAGMDDLPVTCDVEWRTIEDGLLTQAPRGDVVVGTHLDPITRYHHGVPLLVVEIWSPETRPSERRSKREYWARRGVDHYWEVALGQDLVNTSLFVYNFSLDTDELVRADGNESLALTEPFPVEVTPGQVRGWVLRESLRADAAKARADAAHEEAEQAKAGADAERQERLAQIERRNRINERIQHLEAELRSRGIEP